MDAFNSMKQIVGSLKKKQGYTSDRFSYFFVSDDMGGERARESSEESRRSLLSERGVFVVKGCTVPVTTSSL
jgi:hypothetical protein